MATRIRFFGVAAYEIATIGRLENMVVAES